jgi:hypothetical protein
LGIPPLLPWMDQMVLMRILPSIRSRSQEI